MRQFSALFEALDSTTSTLRKIAAMKDYFAVADPADAAWAVFFQDDGPVIRWRPRFVEVLENGKLALSRGPYRTRTRDADGKVTEQWGTFNSIWRLNADGEWRVVFDAGSPAADEPDDATKALLDAATDCP